VVLANIKLLHAHPRLTLSAQLVVHVVPINTLRVDVLAQQTLFAQLVLLVVLANIKLLHAHPRLTLSAQLVVHVVPINTLRVDVLAQQTPFAQPVLFVLLDTIKAQHVRLHQTPFARHAAQVAPLVNGRTQHNAVVLTVDAELVRLVALASIKRLPAALQ